MPVALTFAVKYGYVHHSVSLAHSVLSLGHLSQPHPVWNSIHNHSSSQLVPFTDIHINQQLVLEYELSYTQ